VPSLFPIILHLDRQDFATCLPDLDIWWRVDRLGTYVTEFYMEYIVLTKICLPYVRAIMAFGRVSLV
jgi:hypothetical protein